MVILSLLFAPFRPHRPGTRFSLRLPIHLKAKIHVAGDAKQKRACIAAEDVDMAAAQSKTLPFLLSAPGRNGGPPGAGFGGGKGTNGVGRIKSAWGPSTPRTERCAMRRICWALRSG